MVIESGFDFSFSSEFTVEKFDALPFYRDRFSKLPNGKGIDFLAVNREQVIFLEVKNCMGHEGDNRWRIFPDNKKRHTTNTTTDTSNRNSLDIEVAEKVAMTLACLFGAYTKCEQVESASFGKFFMDFMRQRKLPRLKVILFLEGNFSSRSRTKAMIMTELAHSIRNKLSWLECQVLVEDSATCRGVYYSVHSMMR